MAEVGIAAVAIPMLVPVVLDAVNDNWPKIVQLFERFLQDLPKIFSAVGKAAKYIGEKVWQVIKGLCKHLNTAWQRVKPYFFFGGQYVVGGSSDEPPSPPAGGAHAPIRLPEWPASTAADNSLQSTRQRLHQQRSAVTVAESDAEARRQRVATNVVVMSINLVDNIDVVLQDLDADSSAYSEFQGLAASLRGQLGEVADLIP